MKNILLIILSLNFISISLFSQNENKNDEPWLVGIKHAPPFVIIGENEEIKGFSIDLIKELAKQINPSKEFTPKFHIDQSLEKHIESVKTKQVDLGIAATTATPERERQLDFSLPFFNGGLGIMVRRDIEKATAFNVIFSRELIPVLIGLVIYIIIVALIIWGIERKSNTFNNGFFSGIGEAIWWTIVTMSTVGYGDFNLSRPVSRVIGILVIFSGIILFGIAIGTFSSALTLNNMKNQINGPQDLVAKKIATVNDSTAYHEMSARGASVKGFHTINDCIQALKAEEVIAVVYDMPQLKYQVKIHGTDKFMITGPQFKSEEYGIIFPLGSNLRKQINIALLKIKERNRAIYKSIYTKWFGPMKD